MFLLPTNLGRLADLADKHDSTRFSLGSVLVAFDQVAGKFEAAVTDSKQLLVVSGPLSEKGEYPLPDLSAAPNGATSALIGAKTWRRLFSSAEKVTAKNKGGYQKAVAVQPSEKVTTFAAAGQTGDQMNEQVGNTEGRFPPYRDIIGQNGKGDATTVRMDPKQLAEVLRTMAMLQTDPSYSAVSIEIRGPHKPVIIRATGPGGLEMVAVVMPLCG